jgi:aspartokinase
LEKNIPIRVTNTLDITHPGTLIEPARQQMRPRVCEITVLPLAQYETANKTKIDTKLHDPSVSIIALIGHQVRLVSGIEASISATIKKTHPNAKFEVVPSAGPIDKAEVIMVLVESGAASSIAKALYAALLGRKDVSRWLVPSRVPTTPSLTPASGAGWA